MKLHGYGNIFFQDSAIVQSDQGDTIESQGTNCECCEAGRNVISIVEEFDCEGETLQFPVNSFGDCNCKPCGGCEYIVYHFFFANLTVVSYGKCYVIF